MWLQRIESGTAQVCASGWEPTGAVDAETG